MDAMIVRSSFVPALGAGLRPLAVSAGLPVAIWLLALDGDEPFSTDDLSAAERERVERFTHQRDARRFALTRITLRRLLADELRCARADVEIVLEPGGKPRLAGAELEFSIARSSGLALIAVSRGMEIGVDIEAIRPRGVERVAARFFTQDECRELASLASARRHAAAFQCWARKEAYVKGTGEGIAGGSLNAAQVGIGGCRAVGPWTVRDVGVPTGFVAALATRTAEGGRTWNPSG